MATDDFNATGSPQPPTPPRPARRTAPRKPAAKASVSDGQDGSAPVAPKTRARKPATKKVSIEDIQLRAYYIAEARQRAGIPGTPEDDWLEAERQLGVAQKPAAAAKPRAKRSSTKKPALG